MPLNFASALYLGMHHTANELPGWLSLSSGMPAGLQQAEASLRLASELARMQGCEHSLVFASTLHWCWDVFAMFRRQPVRLLVDAGAYPLLLRNAQNLKGYGTPVHYFRHFDVDALGKLLRIGSRRGFRPVVISDSICPSCGRVAPVSDYLKHLRNFGGRLLLDDTQGLGVLGTPDPAHAFGQGGGGILRWLDISGPDLLIGASLAKAFGVPLAAVSGGRRQIGELAAHGDTRWHCSPPAMPLLLAGLHALKENRRQGDRLRGLLASRIGEFRNGLQAIGLSASRHGFPMQSLPGISGKQAVSWHRELGAAGIRSLLTRPHFSGSARLTFLLTATHRPADITFCLNKLHELVKIKTIYDHKALNDYFPNSEVDHDYAIPL